MAKKGEDILEVIEVGLIVKLIDQAGLDPKIARDLVAEFIAETRESYGGIRYMIRRGYRRISPEMRLEIVRDFDGTNWRIVCDRYQISRSYLYTLIKKSA